MTVEIAKQDIKGSYREGFVIMGTDRIEVSPDSNVVVYTNDGVQAKSATASGEAFAKGTQHYFSLPQLPYNLLRRVVLSGHAKSLL